MFSMKLNASLWEHWLHTSGANVPFSPVSARSISELSAYGGCCNFHSVNRGGQDWHVLYSSEVVDLHKDTRIRVMKPRQREV